MQFVLVDEKHIQILTRKLKEKRLRGNMRRKWEDDKGVNVEFAL
jgi:hypothetical protein